MKAYNGFSPAQRNKAQDWLNEQWAPGKLPRPSRCCACGQDKGLIDAHAEDYSEPFTAQKLLAWPLCYRCHMMLHCRFHDPAAWDTYRAAIRSGIRFAPIYSRNFGIIKAHLAGDTGPFTQHDPPTRFPLDQIHAQTSEAVNKSVDNFGPAVENAEMQGDTR